MSECDIADEDAAPRGYAEGSRVVALIEAALAEVRADERARCEAERDATARQAAAFVRQGTQAMVERDELRAEVERLRLIETAARAACAAWSADRTDGDGSAVLDMHEPMAALDDALDEVDGD